MSLGFLLFAESLWNELLGLRVDLGIHVDAAAVDVNLVVHFHSDLRVSGDLVLLRAHPFDEKVDILHNSRQIF